MEDSLQFALEEFQREYDFQQSIGRGKFGEVFRVIHKPTKQLYALKRVHCAKQEHARQAEQEIQILKKCEHPRVLKLYRYYRKVYTSESQRGYCTYGLIMELGICSLAELIEEKPRSYSLNDVSLFLRQLIEVGAYLQEKKIVHRDIKPGNIIIFKASFDFKLGDFGLGCHVHNRPKGYAGTLHYSSPKLADYYHICQKTRNPPLPSSNPFKDDVYSVACTIVEVLKSIGFHLDSSKFRQADDSFNQTLKEMLEEDEWQRPCFQLLMYSRFMVESYHTEQRLDEPEVEQNPFKNVVLREEKKVEVPAETVRKVHEFELEEQNKFTEKFTITEPQIFHLSCRPRTAIKISNTHIICGCQNGSLVILNIQTRSQYTLTLKHKGYVSKVLIDRKGNIWTAGGDGLVYLVEIKTLQECIKNNKRTRQGKSKNIFGGALEQQFVDIYLGPQQYKILLNIPKKTNIVEMFCLDEDHFVLGYSDGLIFIRWEGREAQFYNHFQVITCLKVVDSQLYASFFNGNVISYNIKTLTRNNFFHTFKGTVVDFNVCQVENGVSVEVVTCEGCILKVQVAGNKSYTFAGQLPVKNVLGACIIQKEWMTLSASGTLMLGNTELFQCQLTRGWCSLQMCQNAIIGCSSEGQLFLGYLDLS